MFDQNAEHEGLRSSQAALGARRRLNRRSSARRRPIATPVLPPSGGQPIERLYTPLDLAGNDPIDDIGFPGEYPYTRGIHPTGYRGKLWTMRMFAGFGTAEETNARFKYLLAQGQTGLSVAFDLPTLYGRDTDHPQVEGEFGKCGVAVSSLADMEMLFDGIPLDQSHHLDDDQLAGGHHLGHVYRRRREARHSRSSSCAARLQNDILKEYIAQKEYIFPPEPSMRLVVDTIEFGAEHVPQWNPISIIGYHIREAGIDRRAGAGLHAGRWARICAGGASSAAWTSTDFAPRLSFFFNAHNDFFEEIAKYRAARRIWAREMRERFGAQNPRSWWMRFHYADRRRAR